MGVEKVFVHCFMDGRDVPPSSGKDYVKELMDKLEEIGVGKIATVMGRYYAMDRDNRWERVEKAYAAMVYGEGEQADCPLCAMQNSYDKEVTDEFGGAHRHQGRRAHQRGRQRHLLQLPPRPRPGITRTLVTRTSPA